jgi:AraC-like DNA-binding protein
MRILYAEESGFSTLQRFYSMFGRMTGKAPGAFRRVRQMDI